MSNPIIPRRIKPEPNEDSIRRALTSSRMHSKYALLERVRELQEAEEFGRMIGIVLHWLIVKPIQLIALCLTIVGLALRHADFLMIAAFVGVLVYFAGVVVYLSYLTYWN